MIDSIGYNDPRAPETLKGIEALSHYFAMFSVAMFSANAPGWSARVVKSDTIPSVTRVTVAFGGTSPDGSQQVQLGQYFVLI